MDRIIYAVGFIVCVYVGIYFVTNVLNVQTYVVEAMTNNNVNAKDSFNDPPKEDASANDIFEISAEADRIALELNIHDNRDLYQECITEQSRLITLQLIQASISVPKAGGGKDDDKKGKGMEKHLQYMNTLNDSLQALAAANKAIAY